MRGRGLCPWSYFDAASGTGESVVAGAGDDACAGNRALQSDAVKAAVGLEVRGLVDEAILVALFGFDGLQVLEDLTAVRIDEEPATGLLGQVLEGSDVYKRQGHVAPVENFGLYWHFVDIVWIFLFPLLYLISRHQ